MSCGLRRCDFREHDYYRPQWRYDRYPRHRAQHQLATLQFESTDSARLKAFRKKMITQTGPSTGN